VKRVRVRKVEKACLSNKENIRQVIGDVWGASCNDHGA